MARRARIEYEGACYHVVTRGNRKEPIFLDNEDKKRFLSKLRQYKRRYGFLLYAYALMDNHIHLVIETTRVPLSRIMQGVLQSHTQWHNRKYKTVGHVFQGRYKAILCDRNAYLLQLIRYIHLNPLRAGIGRPLQYRWTSHRAYLGLERGDLVDSELVLAQFSGDRRRAIELYSRFIREGMGEGRREEFYGVGGEPVLGDEQFYEEVLKKTRRASGVLKNRTLEQVSVKVEELTGVGVHELRGRARGEALMRARSLFIRLSKLYTGSGCREIADFLNREPGSLGYIENRVNEGDFLEVIDGFEW